VKSECLDGDTIHAHGHTYRLVDFDAPETDRARCEAERVLGQRASHRLRQLVNAGGLDLHEIRCSCPEGTHGTQACNYGRRCGTLKAHGRDVGMILIGEGLARSERPRPRSVSRAKAVGWKSTDSGQ